MLTLKNKIVRKRFHYAMWKGSTIFQLKNEEYQYYSQLSDDLNFFK